MLKGIPVFITPELLKLLCEMGHGDELVIADANFPSERIGKRVVRLDAVDALTVLDGILKLVPLDTYAESPAMLMQVTKGDKVETPIWAEYEKAVASYGKFAFSQLERYAFYERAKEAYVVIHTGEKALYGNLILKKGVL